MPDEEKKEETPKEEEKKETPKEEPPQDESKDDEAVKEKEEDTKSSSSPLEKAEGLVDAMKEQNDRFEKNIETLKKTQAEDLLGGRSLAGKQQTDEDKTKEACRKILPDGMDPFEPPAE